MAWTLFTVAEKICPVVHRPQGLRAGGVPDRGVHPGGRGEREPAALRLRREERARNARIPPPDGDGILIVELRRIELLTSCMPCRRSTN